MKIVILSLRTVNDKIVINYNLTALLTDYFNHHSPTLKIELPTVTIYLSKYAYLNRYKIYSDGIHSFMVFQYKKPDTKLVLKMLIEHSKKMPVLKVGTKHKKVA